MTRDVVRTAKATPTVEGAGVRLNRVFGQVDSRLDPFLLLDHFGSRRPEDYIAGFPWHPHRGIETITYMLEGTVEHGDSLGNKGVIGPGDVQWMSAGSGIIHQEMPQRAPRVEGFQLWSNLPAKSKMMDPRYRDIAAADLPAVALGAGAAGRVICGSVAGTRGPAEDIVTDPLYLDITLDPGATLDIELDPPSNAFLYVYRGDAAVGPGQGRHVEQASLAVLGQGSRIYGVAGGQGARMLLASARPIQEPVAWGGPIVMNTREEIKLAFQEYRDGTFLKHTAKA